MHVPDIFAETRPEVLWPFMAEHRLGTVVAATADGVEAHHLPFEVDPGGVLRCHGPRRHPLIQSPPSSEVLVIFQGPDHYISPGWQPGRERSGRVAPSWNYAVVHAYGRIELREDEAWLRRHLAALAAPNEAGRSRPWTLEEPPEEFTAMLLAQIAGMEIAVTRLVGQFRAAQNYNPATRAAIVSGLRAEPRPDAALLAEVIDAANPSDPSPAAT